MRKTETVVIGPEGGRDAGKAFLLTEMSSEAAEEWAAQVLLALGRTEIQIPANIARAGLAGVASLGLRALSKIAFHDLKPLLGQMMACVQAIPAPEKSAFARALVADDIEEVSTRLTLRYEVFKLHTGFSLPVGLWESTRAAILSTGSSITQTSQEQSAPSSRRAKRR